METALVPMTGRLAPPWHWIFPHLASLGGRAAQTGPRALGGAEAGRAGRRRVGGSYLVSHLAKELLASLPQLP